VNGTVVSATLTGEDVDNAVVWKMSKTSGGGRFTTFTTPLGKPALTGEQVSHIDTHQYYWAFFPMEREKRTGVTVCIEKRNNYFYGERGCAALRLVLQVSLLYKPIHAAWIFQLGIYGTSMSSEDNAPLSRRKAR